MDRLSMDQLLNPGDVFIVTDKKDKADYMKIFVYRGWRDGYFILDPVSDNGRTFPVARVPDYRRLMNLGSEVPGPREKKTASYERILRDLTYNHQFLREAIDIGLKIGYSGFNEQGDSGLRFTEDIITRFFSSASYTPTSKRIIEGLLQGLTAEKLNVICATGTKEKEEIKIKRAQATNLINRFFSAGVYLEELAWLLTETGESDEIFVASDLNLTGKLIQQSSTPEDPEYLHFITLTSAQAYVNKTIVENLSKLKLPEKAR